MGDRLIGDTFWLVTSDPLHAAYVKNIEANSAVRVHVKGQWRTGAGCLLPDDDPHRRMVQLNPVNGLYIAIAGRDFLTIQVQLDPLTN